MKRDRMVRFSDRQLGKGDRGRERIDPPTHAR